MLRIEKEDRPTYVLSYSRWVRLGRAGIVLLLIGGAVVRWVLAWVRFGRPLVAAVGGSAEFVEVLAAQPLRPLIAAHIGLLLTAGAVAFVYQLLPDLALTDDGLAMRTVWGWRVIPWEKITAMRINLFEESGRRLVVVQGNWTRWSPGPRLVSACLGAGLDPGVLFTSDIRDFKPLMRRMYQDVKGAVPEAIFDDEFFSLPALLALEPTPTLADLADQARDEGWPVSISAQVMAAVAGGLMLVQVLILILVGGVWWKPMFTIGLITIEWAIGGLYLYALAEFFPARIDFRQAGLLYPLTQTPRAVLSLPMAMFVAAGMDFPVAILGMAGILWAVTLTALLVQQMYRLESVLPAIVGGAFQALLQFLILAFALTG